MTLSQQTAGGVVGFVPRSVIATCIARGGNIAVNTVVALCISDFTQISDDGVTVSTEYGGDGSVFANVTGTFSQAVQKAGLFGVTLEPIADGQKGRVQFVGVLRSKVQHSNNSSISIGSHMLVSSDGTTDSTNNPNNIRGNLDARGISGNSAKDTRKLVALSLQAYSTAPTSNGTVLTVLMDGINGLGGTNS